MSRNRTAAWSGRAMACAGLSMASVASADTFNNLSDFLAAVPDATLVNFDTVPGGGPAALGEIGGQYSALGLNFPPGNLISSVFFGPVSPPNGWLNNTFVGSDPTFDVNITGPGVRAVGVHNVAAAAPNGAILRAFDSGGTELESVSSDTDPGSLDFFGVTTDADIARVTISVINAGGWGLDDLYIGEGGGGGTGADIRIDLSTLVSTTPGNWNNVSDVGGITRGLIDFNTGASTDVSINGNSSGWRPFFADDGGAFVERDWLIQPSTVDGAGIDQGITGVYTIAGLTGSSYRIEVVSARTCCDYLNTITVQGDFADRTFLGTPVVTPWGSLVDGLTPSNWLIWDGVAPSGGEIDIRNVADPATLGVITTLRILEEGGGGCYADCDGSGDLDFFDFLCYQNEFAAQTAYADCDGSGQLDFFDFLCYQNEFAAGCP